MNAKRQITCIILPALIWIVLDACVSKKEYLMKAEESKRSSSELKALKSDYAKLVRERDDLAEERMDLQLKILSLEQDIARREQENTNLEEILQSKSDTLSNKIVELQAQNSLLKQENEALQSEVLALEVDREEKIFEMRTTYEDLLEDMKSEIEKGKITITQLEGKLKVNMVDEILFDSGKTTIKSQGVKILERVGKILLSVRDQTISIEGHTDDVPIGPELAKRYPTNWELSTARATSVARYLQEKSGIDPSLISATGYGEYQPIASNETEEGRARNRRIEIVLIPKEIAPSSRK